MKNQKVYEGIDKEVKGGMTPTANIIRDAWIFGIIPETETCAGWTVQAIERLYGQVMEAWEPYGHLMSKLPEDLRERHARIYGAAVKRARAEGWSPELEEDED